jgi:hypothetical protein
LENYIMRNHKRGFLCSFREWMGGFHDMHKQKPCSHFMFWGWSSVFHLPDDIIHISRFGGEDTGV